MFNLNNQIYLLIYDLLRMKNDSLEKSNKKTRKTYDRTVIEMIAVIHKAAIYKGPGRYSVVVVVVGRQF